MKWKKPTILLASGLLIFGLAGSSFSPFTACRLHDFKDMLTAALGRGFGFKLRIGPVHCGLLKNRDWAGLRGGEFFQQRSDVQGSEDVEIIAWGQENLLEGYFRGKDYDVGLVGLKGHPVLGLFDLPFVSLPKNVPWTYYTQCELVVGLGGSLRLGINPGEIVDWLLGWVGMDICRDDYLLMPEFVGCRHITAAGVKGNAARISGRNGQYKEYEAYDPDSALGIAVGRDRVDIARALVATGIKPLIFPTASPAMAQAMIDMGADVNASVHALTGVFSMTTPLVNVARKGSVGTIKVLLKHGANVNAADKDDGSALFYAVIRRDVPDEETSCHPEIVKALLAAGARTDIAVPNWHSYAKTILGCAITGSGSAKIVELLLAAGADPNSEDTLGIALVDEFYKDQSDDSPIVRELIKGGAKIENSHLFKALHARNVWAIKALLEAGVDANVLAAADAGAGSANKPPLLAAFSFSYREAWLLRGARPLNEKTRLTLAPIVEILLDHGADTSYPGVLPEARKFLKGTPVLERMEKLAQKRSDR